MEIIVGKTAGFCFGVKNAVNKAEELLKKKENTYCLGELVHNSQVMDKLCKQGLKVIHDLTEIKSLDCKVIIRAHGVSPEVYEKAKLNGIELVDFTCPKVARIHEKAKAYIEKDSYIFILGKKDHPEIIGTYGFCDGKAYVIERLEDVEAAIFAYEKSGFKKIAVIAQTTFSVEKFDEIVEDLEDKLFLEQEKFKNTELMIDNTICNATFERQKEAEELSRTVDLMIIIGGKSSSNTKKLYEVSTKYCTNVISIETAEELDVKKIEKCGRIGIMAGASTPRESIENVLEALNGYSK